jgi:hypothetical protein
MNNGLWTEAEERSLIHFYLILGRKWKEIAEHFPDRTDKDCKCHLASLVANRLEIPYQQAYDKISHPKVKFLKNLRKMEEARYGDPATATGAVGPANLRPVRLQAPPPLAPWPAPVQGLAADRDGTPVAVDGAVDLALLSPRLPASRPALRPAHLHIPVQGPAADGYGTPVAVDGAADLALLSPRLPASRPALPPAFLFPMIVQAGAAADGRGAAATGELLAPRVVQARTPANGTPAAATGAVGLANPLPALPFYF